MKLLRELASLAPYSEFDVGAEEYTFPNVYKDKGKVAKKKIKKRSVIMRRSSDGRVYGRRTTYSK
jgi:hypothetical protein